MISAIVPIKPSVPFLVSIPLWLSKNLFRYHPVASGPRQLIFTTFGHMNGLVLAYFDTHICLVAELICIDSNRQSSSCMRNIYNMKFIAIFL